MVMKMVFQKIIWLTSHKMSYKMYNCLLDAFIWKHGARSD